jgi:hypothetical protein
MTQRSSIRRTGRKSEVSVTRLRSLTRMKNQANQLTKLFLAGDDEGPRIFDRAARNDLRIALGVVVEAEDVFAKLRRLRSESARQSEAEWLCMMILGNIDSISHVKIAMEHFLADCHVDRSGPLPKSLSTLMDAHGRQYSLMRQPGGDDNARAKRLLRLLQLELIWFGQMW